MGGRRVGLPVVSLIEEKAVFLLVFAFVLVLFFVAAPVLTCLLVTSLVGINIVITWKLKKKINVSLCAPKNCQRVMEMLQRLWSF